MFAPLFEGLFSGVLRHTKHMSAPTTYELEKLNEAKDKGYSFFLIKGEDDAPPFLYSVGMAQRNLPDVLMFLDSEYVVPQIRMLTGFLDYVIEGSKRFDAEALSDGLDGITKMMEMPAIEYDFNLLKDEDREQAISNYMCRCHFFQNELGAPKALVVSSDFNPTWEEVNADPQPA